MTSWKSNFRYQAQNLRVASSWHFFWWFSTVSVQFDRYRQISEIFTFRTLEEVHFQVVGKNQIFYLSHEFHGFRVLRTFFDPLWSFANVWTVYWMDIRFFHPFKVAMSGLWRHENRIFNIRLKIFRSRVLVTSFYDYLTFRCDLTDIDRFLKFSLSERSKKYRVG